MNHGSRIRRIMAGLFLVLGLAGATLTASAQDYDLVILNGRVMDPESMLDATLNVGVKNGRIAIISKEKITGKETIDATGHVVAPGFIDTHFHSLDGLSMKIAARDGVTTGMDLEMGAINVDQWYAAKKDQWPLNYGTTISQEGVRMLVHDPEAKIEGPQDATAILGDLQNKTAADGVPGWSVTRSTLEQMNKITALLDEGLRQGALGLASTVAYMRDGLSTYEQFQAQKAAARYGRLTAVHGRMHGNNKDPEGPHGFNEVYANASVLRAPLLYQHDNEYGWWEIEEKLQLARAQGLNMWSEYYPYDAASTAIGASFLVPKSFEGAFDLKYEKDMYDPTQDKYLTKDEYLKIAREDPGRIVVIFNPPRKKWLPYWLRMPHMTVAADSIYSGLSWDAKFEEYKGHPRTAGSRGKVLRLGREQGVPLMFTIAQMSYWPAKHLGDAGIDAMKVRGRLQHGMVADITIFDPEKVTDNATYKMSEQGKPTTGIPYVIVNGQMVVKDSEFRKVWSAGQPIRFPVEAKGRFIPISVEEWTNNFAIPTIDVHQSGAEPNIYLK